MKITFLKHDCWAGMMASAANGEHPKKCPFYFRLFNAHCFTLFGYRMIVGEFR